MYVSVCIILNKSVGWTEECLWHLILQVCVSDNSCEEPTNVIWDEQQVADHLSFVIDQAHVILHVGLAVGQEQEVSVVCTLLAADPHHPDEDYVEVDHEVVLEVHDPYYDVDELDYRRHVRSLQGHSL